MIKILYVEDNDDNIYMLSQRLKRKGFDVIVAKDGQQGIEAALSESPALILMDLNMPVLDGWSATQRLKSTPATQHIPVIALSAHAMSGDRETALAAGCDDYDSKPVNITRLYAKIQALLPSPD